MSVDYHCEICYQTIEDPSDKVFCNSCGNSLHLSCVGINKNSNDCPICKQPFYHINEDKPRQVSLQKLSFPPKIRPKLKILIPSQTRSYQIRYNIVIFGFIIWSLLALLGSIVGLILTVLQNTSGPNILIGSISALILGILFIMFYDIVDIEEFEEGNEAFKSGDYKDAILHYKKAAGLGNNFPYLHYNWGITLEALGEHEKAIQKFKETVKIEPKFAPAYEQWILSTRMVHGDLSGVISKIEKNLAPDMAEMILSKWT